MTIFKITHTYSSPKSKYRKYLESDMSFIDMWNHIKILQNITWDIDTSHDLDEDDVAYLMSKFFNAKIINPTKLQTRDCLEIDLYKTWESGYINERGGRTIPRDQTEAMMEKYNFYKQGLYSTMLSRFLEQHNFGEGGTGAWESMFMDNEVWKVLFQEGVYDRATFLAEQSARPEYIEKCNWEKQRRERYLATE